MKKTHSVKTGTFYGWYIVIASWMMIFLQYSVSFSIFFKPILEEFKWDRAMLSSVQSIGLLAFTIISPFLGRLIDRVGPRIMIAISAASQIISALLNGIASSIWYLYAARFTYGITVYPPAQVLVSRWFMRLKGTALGIVTSAMPIGTLVLTPISQFLILSWNWRVTMLFWAAVMLVVILPLLLVIRNSPREKGLEPDGEKLRDKELKTSLESTAHARVVPPEEIGHTISQAIKTSGFWLLALTQIACGIGCGFMMTHIVIFATDVGFSDMIGATLVSVQGAFNLIGVIALGYLSDKMVRKNTLALTHLIRSISFAVLIMFTLLASNSLWLLYVAMALFGIGWFTTAPLSTALAADLYGNLRLGTILGMTMGCHMLGMAIGAYMGGAIFDATGSYLLFFIIQCPVEFVAVIFAFFIKAKKAY